MDALAAISRTVVRSWPCSAKSFCAASRIAARVRSDFRSFCILTPHRNVLSTVIDKYRSGHLICQRVLIKCGLLGVALMTEKKPEGWTGCTRSLDRGHGLGPGALFCLHVVIEPCGQTDTQGGRLELRQAALTSLIGREDRRQIQHS